jgi:hypothetical protein
MTGAIGNNLLNAPDMFTYDGVGNLVGTREITTDAGVHSTQVVSMNATTGDTTVLGTNVTELTGTTYVAAVDVWPHP